MRNWRALLTANARGPATLAARARPSSDAVRPGVRASAALNWTTAAVASPVPSRISPYSSPAGLIGDRVYRLASSSSIAALASSSQASGVRGSAPMNAVGIALRSATILTIRSPSARASPGTVPAVS